MKLTIAVAAIVMIAASASCQNRNPWESFVSNPNSANHRRCAAEIADSQSLVNRGMTVKHVKEVQWTFLNLVKRGNPKAMDLCIQLYPFFETPVYYASDLEYFDKGLGESVKRNPRSFIALICKNARSGRNTGFSLSDILGSTPSNLVDNFKAQKRELTARLRAIESVKDVACLSTRDSCVITLQKQIARLSQVMHERSR